MLIASEDWTANSNGPASVLGMKEIMSPGSHMQMRSVIIIYSRGNDIELNLALPTCSSRAACGLLHNVTLPVETFEMIKHFVTLFRGKSEKECSIVVRTYELFMETNVYQFCKNVLKQRRPSLRFELEFKNNLFLLSG